MVMFSLTRASLQSVMHARFQVRAHTRVLQIVILLRFRTKGAIIELDCGAEGGWFQTCSDL